jgi:hypothetical protein
VRYERLLTIAMRKAEGDDKDQGGRRGDTEHGGQKVGGRWVGVEAGCRRYGKMFEMV